MTKYERAIYEIIIASHAHLTANEVFEKLKLRYPAVVLATVYNNLNKICESGLIHKVSVEGIPDRYDRVQRHDHLVCRRCGAVMDITFRDLSETLREKLGEDFLFYDLKVYYLCSACREKEKMPIIEVNQKGD